MVFKKLKKAFLKTFLSEEEKHKIVKAIQDAEKQTSGQIRVHIESHCDGHPYERAKEVFGILGMHHTAHKNATLIYLAVQDRKLAVLGDFGIHNRVPSEFWHEIKDTIREHFKEGEFSRGICEGIHRIGEQLKTHFPHSKEDRNELPDDISFGK